MPQLRVPREIRRLSRERAPAFYRRLSLPNPSQIASGQIWSTQPQTDNPKSEPVDPRIIVILVADEEDLVGAPISIATQMAAQYDLVLKGDQSPLGFDIMVEVWNEIPIVSNQFRKYLGSLEGYFAELLTKLHASFLLNEPTPKEVRSFVGPSLGAQDDCRRVFQTEEILAVDYLARNATRALEADLSRENNLAKNQIISLGQPVLTLLREVLGPQKAVAHADGGQYQNTTPGHFIVYEHQDDKVILELLVRRRQEVYAIVHHVSESLAGRRGSLQVVAEDVVLTSEPIVLENNLSVQLGDYKGFQPSAMTEDVELELYDARE